MTKKAECTLVENYQFTARSESGHAVVMDTSYMEGTNSGATPMELVLMGLMGCTGMDVISILRKKKKQFSYFKIKCTAELADDYPKVYTQIHLHYIVKGRKVDEESVRRAIDLSRETYCSVSAMLGKTADITYGCEVHPED